MQQCDSVELFFSLAWSSAFDAYAQCVCYYGRVMVVGGSGGSKRMLSAPTIQLVLLF